MARPVKCQWCQISDTQKEEMEFEIVGIKKPIKKYYHKLCWGKHLKHKEFIADEMKKKDELNEVIKEIYGVKEVPEQAWVFLEKLRGGNPIFKNQQVGKRYREGYEYPLIKETFEYCSETIEYYNRVKNFDGFLNAFRYALVIIVDKIYAVEQRKKERERQEMLIEKHTQNEKGYEEFVSNYKKKDQSKTDITDFLD